MNDSGNIEGCRLRACIHNACGWIRDGNSFLWGGVLVVWAVRMLYVWVRLAYYCPEGGWPVVRFAVVAWVLMFAPGVFLLRAFRVKCARAATWLMLVMSLSLSFSALAVWTLYLLGGMYRGAVVGLLVILAGAGTFGIGSFNVRRGFLSVSAQWREMSVSSRLTAFFAVLFLQGLFESVVATPMTAWDALVSWDKWASDMAVRNGLGNYAMGGYPQFIPTLHSVFYKVAGTGADVLPVEHLLLHGFLAVYVGVMVMALIRLCAHMRAPWSVALLLFVGHREVFSELVSGYVDIPLTAAIVTLWAAILDFRSGAWKTDQGIQGPACVFGLLLFAVGFIKGSGLTWVVLLTGLMLAELRRLPRFMTVVYAVGIAFMGLAPFYFHQWWLTQYPEHIERSSHLHTFLLQVTHTSLFSPDISHAGDWMNRFMAGYGLSGTVGVLGFCMLCCSVCLAIRCRRLRVLCLSGVGMLMLWFYTASYDMRNALPAVCLLSIAVVGGGLAQVRGWLRQAIAVAAFMLAFTFLPAKAKSQSIATTVARLWGAFPVPKSFLMAAERRHMALRPWGDIREILYSVPYGLRATHINAANGLYRVLAPRGTYTLQFNAFTDVQRHDLLVLEDGQSCPVALCRLPHCAARETARRFAYTTRNSVNCR